MHKQGHIGLPSDGGKAALAAVMGVGMWKNVVHVLHGYAIWSVLKVKYGIRYPKAVLVLAGQNEELDNAALDYFGYYVKRKFAGGAVVLVKDGTAAKRVRGKGYSFPVKLCVCKKSRMDILYGAYSFYKFYDNIVFTYDNQPGDNMLGRLLGEKLADAGEAVCLGLFGLHQVPGRKT